MKSTFKKIYKSLQEKVLKQLNKIQNQDNESNQSDVKSSEGSEETNQQGKIPSFFLLLLDLKSSDQVEIFEEHMKDTDVKDKLQVALDEMIESYKNSQDTDIAIAFLKNMKDLTSSFAKKKWGPTFIKKDLIPKVFEMIIMSSESSVDQKLIGKAIRSLNECLGQNLSVSDVMENQAQCIFKLQKENEQNRFYFINVLPSLLEYLEFEQKQFLIDMFLNHSFSESLSDIDFKNVGEYLPIIKQMIIPLQFYLKDINYFKIIDDQFIIQQYDLIMLGSNALFLKKVYQMKYFKTCQIQATHYIQGTSKVKIEKEETINKIKYEGDNSYAIFKVLLKLIQQFIFNNSSNNNEEHKKRLILPILECLFFYLDNMDIKEYNFNLKCLKFLDNHIDFIESNLIEIIPKVFVNYSKIISPNSNFDYIDYFTRNLIKISKLINMHPLKLEQTFNYFLSSEPKQMKQSIYWFNSTPALIEYFNEKNYFYNAEELSNQLECILMRRSQLHVDDQKRMNEKQIIQYLPLKKIKPKQEFLDEYYTKFQQKQNSKNWREREEAVFLLKDLISYMDIRSLFVCIVADFFDLCSDRIAEVRRVAAWHVDCLFSRLPPRSPASNVFYQALIQNVNAFYNSSTYQLRQVFVIMCASLMAKNSRIYLSYFQLKLASLAQDPVANVRISLAKVVTGHIQEKQAVSLHKTTFKIVSALKKDAMKDVRNIVNDIPLGSIHDNNDDNDNCSEIEYDSKTSDDSSNTQLTKNEVEQFTNSSTIIGNYLTSDPEVDPFDILLNDAQPQQIKQRSRGSSIELYVDEKIPTANMHQALEAVGSPTKNSNEQFDDLNEETFEEYNKIVTQLQKEVEEEEKWPELQKENKKNTNQEQTSGQLTPIDLLDELDDIFSDIANSYIEQQKITSIKDIQQQPMIQTIN